MTSLPLVRPVRRARAALRRLGLARVVVGLWLAVHGFAVSAAPVADALVGHADTAVAHWEDDQDSSCPPLHDPATCQLCQHLATTLPWSSDRASIAVPLVLASAEPRWGVGLDALNASRRGVPDPRGPPQG